jgi:hypothetical protein
MRSIAMNMIGRGAMMAGLVAVLGSFGANRAGAAAIDKAQSQGQTIAFVLSYINFAMYETPDPKKAECPEGFNASAEANLLAAQERDPEKRKAWELKYGFGPGNYGANGLNMNWNWTSAEDPIPHKDARGPTALGINLDGRVGPNDFTSPEGERGIDNQLWRSIGCVTGYRTGGGAHTLLPIDMSDSRYGRLIIEVSGVDSLQDDPDVVIRTFRGLDPVMRDSVGEGVAGATQHVDQRYSRRYEAQTHGKIVGGVLRTDPMPFHLVHLSRIARDSLDIDFRSLVFSLKVGNGAIVPGYIAGYADVQSLFTSLIGTQGNGILAYGNGISQPSLYRSILANADANPNPITGKNTAISMAFTVKFTPVILVHDTPIAPAKNQTLASASK